MQFPYPRKTSNPSAFQPTARASSYRQRRHFRRLALYALAAFTLLVTLLWLLGPSATSAGIRRPAGAPDVVIITPLAPALSPQHRDNIIVNRKDYASRHGYATFFPNTTDYDLMPSTPSSWSTVPAIRHALTLYPHTPWLFHLAATALIMNPREPLSSKLLEPRKLESLMLVDRPVVPPDSVIRTFSHLKGERVDVILTQSADGLAHGSMLVRSGEWAKFFLDSWFDPLYRSYNFQKAEGHALEHLVQWHGTVLARLAIVPQRVLNGYTKESGGSSEGLYQEGDFVANSHDCERDAKRSCEEEMQPLMSRWRELRDGERR